MKKEMVHSHKTMSDPREYIRNQTQPAVSEITSDKATTGTEHKIRYTSTNGAPEAVDFKTALLVGQAKDKGLYMPDRIPVLPEETIESMSKMSYPEIAFVVINQFLKDEIPQNELKRMTKEAYDFEVPLQEVYDRRYIMWQCKGPTKSFKDLAARMMSRLMQYYAKDINKHITILTATSGDTGSAVANAFYGLDGISCVVLFPKNEVTEIQRKQMTTLGGNVTTFAVDGKFDDCQAMVKRAFTDPKLERLSLSSANSINFGRLLPQLVQYFYAYSGVADTREHAVISVPCGNFGHITAGIISKRMGLPIHKFIVATNANDEFPRFLQTGIYKPIVPSRDCISNSMNVGHPSNLARVVDLYRGKMDEKGIIMKMPDLGLMRGDIFSTGVSDDETRRTIKEVYEDYGIVLEPHGAVAWAGLMRYLKGIEDWYPCVSFETADPGKFPEEITKTLGVAPNLPKELEALRRKEEHFINIPNQYEAFKEKIMHLEVN